jgi:hypothetical protein
MLRAARRLKIAEASDMINLHSIPLTNHKYVEGLRDFYRQEADLLSGFDPLTGTGETRSKPKRELSDEEMKHTQRRVLSLFAMRKRINGI